VYLYSVEQGKSFPVTDGLSESAEPVFDASGKYLYFLASNDTGMSKHGFMQSASDARPPRWSIYLAVLRKDVPSPFLTESDEEKGKTDEKAPSPRPRIDDEPKKDDAKKKDEKPAPKGEKAPTMKAGSPGFTIEFDGLDQRILALPLQP